ncbi:unnamed protein product [Ambrosiozyma monospora]|uniref:Unnamed protein product n=1 Tax=Ambrosiozyma monospora TaxID=43982 RepID=A0A9W6T7R0_AMBMO|nr:unnamed protein product [Ambrosiozyma monospora]
MSPDVSTTSLSALADGTDDNSQFDTFKQRKTAFLECVRSFNFKPKRGIKQLIQQGFIPDDKPESIAKFLLENDSLSKAGIGEYLGEGDQQNIDIMHAFVDFMDFKDKSFLGALRFYLEHFRLPGESQKIDRFMLKFAEKYVTDNPDTVFANAEAVYILSYSRHQ